MKKLMLCIFSAFFLATTASYAQNPSGSLNQQAIQAKVDAMAKVLADKAEGDIEKIKSDAAAKKQAAQQSKTKARTGTVKKIEMYEKPFAGRLGHLSFDGWGVEIFQDTILNGKNTFSDIAPQDALKVEYYPYGGFDHAVSVTYLTQN